MLSFLIARDNMHQNQWLAAIAELEADGLEQTPVPCDFPRELEAQRFSYQFWNLSTGLESAEGRWAKGPTPDCKGTFQYVENPQPQAPAPEPPPRPNPKVYDTTLGNQGRSGCLPLRK